MARIYPDTNRFVDFYRTSHEKIVVLDELLKIAGSIVLTEQTITEFRRNRVSQLKKLIKQFRDASKSCNADKPALLLELPEYKELAELVSQCKKKRKEIVRHLEQLVEDEQKDPVAQRFLALAGDAALTKLKLTNETIDRAHKRKFLGNPPCSPDRYTVGDEVIWELLLENMKDDLIVVTEDGTFHENLSLLREEYQHRTEKKLLLVTKKLSEALELIGQNPTQELIEVEKKEQEMLPPLGWLEGDDGGAHWIAMQEATRRRQSAAWRYRGSDVQPWESMEGLPSPGRTE
ncbi:MAG: DUF4935 domain-containing protein [Planctomycetes bacterium]|nr:DUF4935 domain-containing protein [Planctomycetota bacterium]